jgi:hypothetical protein
MTTQIIKQTLAPTQVFEALSKGFNIEYAEIETNDWEPLTQQARLGLRYCPRLVYAGWQEMFC